MCGIFLCVCDQDNQSTIKEILKNETIQVFLSRRGPDHFEKMTFEHEFEQDSAHFTLLSSVLQLRGCFVCNQPVKHESSGSVLQWNGQIFRGLQNTPQHRSDTEELMEELNDTNNDQEILSVLSSIHGPWAFSYWDNKAKKLWIGRDVLGRRSLCWNVNNRDKVLVISSVAHIYSTENGEATTKKLNVNPADLVFEEIPCFGVYCFDFGAFEKLSDVIGNVKHYAWNRTICGKDVENGISKTPKLNSPITQAFNRELPSDSLSESFKNITSDDINEISTHIPDEIIDSFKKILSESVGSRCGNHHNVCRKCFGRYVKQSEAMLSSESEDELRRCKGSSTSASTTINGVTFRECCHASTAILFSGGIDSTVLALLADDFVPKHLPIDLLNVAFNNDAPDRETGLRAWEELIRLRPNRKWNFVSIHIGKEELESYRSKHIKYLVKPSQTVLDDSIGCAVWFATRGKGLLMKEPGVIGSTSQTRARVVLLGMGADEQLGGYSRHRAAFNQSGWDGLVKELQMDIERISSRNLGRDDRVTADHGIEARFPFLDERVISFLNSLPVWQKCNLNLERSCGEKLLLRVLAHRLGLRASSKHLKRAIQFGSRIAKLEERSEKGDHSCSRLSC